MVSFQQFLDLVPKLKQSALPGLDSQLKMAAVDRFEKLKNAAVDKKNARLAAVMMLVYPKNDMPHFALIERVKSTGKHSGQIAFPGGRQEPEDNGDHAITAQRETWEEIGVPILSQHIITAGTAIYIPPSNYVVHAFLAFAKAELSFTPQLTEVNAVIEVPLEQLLDDKNLSTQVLSTSYMNDIEVPCYCLENHIVWGATAMMLSEFKDLIKEHLSL